MSVLGVGVDLVDVPGFGDQLERPGTHLRRAFRAGERAAAEDRVDGPAAHLAARWAAKEAVVKAWSAALHGRAPVLDEAVHHEIEVVQDAWDRPRIVLHGQVAEAVRRDHPGARFEVSLSHDGDAAIAYVVMTEDPCPEAVPSGSASVSAAWR